MTRPATTSPRDLSRRLRQAALAAAGLLGLLWTAAPSIGAEDETGWRLERFSEAVKVQPGAPVRVVNPIGDIRVRGSDEPHVEVLANIQVAASDPEAPRVEVEEEEGALVVRASAAGPVTGRLPRVDLTVFVPRASPLVLRTGAGLAEAKGLDSAVDAASDRGDLWIEAAGPVRTETVHGRTTVRFLAGSWSGGSSCRSVTGDIEVRLAPDPDVTVAIDTIGTITTDFSIDVSPLGQGERKRARAEVGAGTSRLELSSERGRVSLLRGWFR